MDAGFPLLTIDDNAQISVRNSKNGNLQVIALSGIYYKPFLKKYPVNFFKLNKANGDIKIDYDSDNDQKVINIKKDLLK